jgi:glycosyltransferase involved in cell wall biosynthesis
VYRIKKLANKTIKFTNTFSSYLLSVFGFIWIFLHTLFAIRKSTRLNPSKPRLVWGDTPIINNKYWSKAMREAGYFSETFTTDFYTINTREDWDRILSEEWKGCNYRFKPYHAFAKSLLRYDIFFIPYSGFFLGNTPLSRFQHYFFKKSNKKVVVIPYGADSYVYNRIRSTALIHGLLMSYPSAARKQDIIGRNVDYWTKHAGCVINGPIGFDGFGRWDVLMLSALHIDLAKWRAKSVYSTADGVNTPVCIVHAPNHRGFKGTEFIVDIIAKLKEKGLKIEFILIEKMKNSVVKELLYKKADILVEQLIFTGHGLNGLEGMATGLPTISNLEDEAYILPMRRWSYFSECPIVSATPENLEEVLYKLVTSPGLREKLGRAGRAYAEKYHGLDSARFLFENVIDYIHGRKESLINLYHPLLGEYPNRSPRIVHPLVNNRIPEDLAL